jgi:hypothetical protein
VSVIRLTDGEYIGSSGLRLLVFFLGVDTSPSPGTVRCKLELRLEVEGRWCKSTDGTEDADDIDDPDGMDGKEGMADAEGKDGKNGRDAEEADEGTDEVTDEGTEA